MINNCHTEFTLASITVTALNQKDLSKKFQEYFNIFSDKSISNLLKYN